MGVQTENTEKNVQFNISFHPPEKVSARIMEMNNALKAYWADDYALSSAHLTLYYTTIPGKNIPALKEIVRDFADGLARPQITLGEIIVENDYVMLMMQDDSQLKEINRQLVSLIGPLRESALGQKYIDNWDTYSEETKRLITETGHQYGYRPHLTLAKVRPGNVEEVRQWVKAHTFKGIAFTPEKVRLGISEGETSDKIGTERLEFELRGSISHEIEA